MSYHMRHEPCFEARIYIGSKVGYTGEDYSVDDVRAAIGQYQQTLGPQKATPVRITPTQFVWEDYNEPGWEIAAINYPRAPKSKAVISSFALGLAGHLLEHFRQDRISVVFPDEIVMLEADDPEKK